MEGSSEIVTVFQYLHHVDKDVTLAVNSCWTEITDQMWQVFSAVKMWYILYVAVIVFMFIRLGWKKALVSIGCCVLFVVACDQFANIIKDAVCRLRPLHDAEMIARGLHVLEPADNHIYGFFSAHAANTMGFAICSLLCLRTDKTRSYRAYGIAIIIWAVLVGVSRVFVGKHFVGDVLAGWLVGLILGAAFGLLCKYLCNVFKVS